VTTHAGTVWTIGHSNRSIEAFVAALSAHGIEIVADVRRFAGSRRLPQFGELALSSTLDAAGIGYAWLPSLGGRRRPLPGSINAGWRNDAFRGYADHLASEEFGDGLFQLLLLARGARTAVMCAEMLWWQCHRRLIADVLTVIGYDVIHLRDERHGEPHRLVPPAQSVRGVLRYDAAA
jgi:uncharacterized protein (DUF488 family)